MKIIQRNSNQVTCDNCNSVLEWESTDLRWTHTEPDYYYVTCPCCGSAIWIKQNERLNRLWKLNGGRI